MFGIEMSQAVVAKLGQRSQTRVQGIVVAENLFEFRKSGEVHTGPFWRNAKVSKPLERINPVDILEVGVPEMDFTQSRQGGQEIQIVFAEVEEGVAEHAICPSTSRFGNTSVEHPGFHANR